MRNGRKNVQKKKKFQRERDNVIYKRRQKVWAHNKKKIKRKREKDERLGQSIDGGEREREGG